MKNWPFRSLQKYVCLQEAPFPVPGYFPAFHIRPEPLQDPAQFLWILIGYLNLYQCITAFPLPARSRYFHDIPAGPLCRRGQVLAHRSPAHKNYLLRIYWIIFKTMLTIAAILQTLRCFFIWLITSEASRIVPPLSALYNTA